MGRSDSHLSASFGKASASAPKYAGRSFRKSCTSSMCSALKFEKAWVVCSVSSEIGDAIDPPFAGVYAGSANPAVWTGAKRGAVPGRGRGAVLGRLAAYGSGVPYGWLTLMRGAAGAPVPRFPDFLLKSIKKARILGQFFPLFFTHRRSLATGRSRRRAAA